jgi:hypothetical protein
MDAGRVLDVTFLVSISVASISYFVRLFSAKYRSASLWFRGVVTLIAISGVTYTAVGLYLAEHRLGSHSDLPSAKLWFFSHFDSLVGGLWFGLMTALLLSAEFWRFERGRNAHLWRSPLGSFTSPNQSLQPTAGREENHEGEIRK